jgi:hypothetical protein
MAINRGTASVLRIEVEATLQQAKRMEEVLDSLARFGASLVRLPVLLLQALTLVLALPFAGAHALTGLLDRSATRLDKAVDGRLAKVSKAKPVVLPRATSAGTASTLRPSHSA